MAKLFINIPCYNEQENIKQTITSLQNQTFEDFRAVIHDNCSTDNTADTVSNLIKDDNRFFLNKCTFNTGPDGQLYRFRSFNNEEYIGMRSANDRFDANYFKDCIEILDSEKSVGLAYSHGYEVNSNGDISEVSNDFAIDTRGKDNLQGSLDVVSKYTYPFSLWGIFRREVYEKCRLRVYRYGSDHAFIAEAALYGSIANISTRQDYRTIAQTNITKVAKSQLEEESRNVSENSLLYGLKYLTPFSDMISNHMDMFSMAQIDSIYKEDLMERSRNILISRFEKHLILESQRFIEFLESNVIHLQEHNLTNNFISLAVFKNKVREVYSMITLHNLADNQKLRAVLSTVDAL